MLRSLALVIGFAALLSGTALPPDVWAQSEGTRFFMLHHSTGRNLLEQGGAREYLATQNLLKDSSHVLWDHDYNYIGLKDPEDQLLGYGFAVPDDNTDPDGLHKLWTTANSARDSILSRFDVIAFKSCYPASDISSDEMLAQYKTWYLEIREVLDQHPDKIFVVMSQPPLHRLGTDTVRADRARAFANWLGSEEFLSGHPNVKYFNFFDHLAQADDGSATRNMLRYEFEQFHTIEESHPNVLANETVCPLFVDFLLSVAESTLSPVVPPASAVELLPNYPNPFNPSTRISFRLGASSAVEVKVFDVRGALVKSIWSGELAAGTHQMVWEGEDLQGRAMGSGTYFLRLKTPEGVLFRKMQLVK